METFARSDSYLRQKGIKASYQRVCIYDYSMNAKTHPSVSQVDGPEVRYDLSGHGHFHCSGCRAIIDVPVGDARLPESLDKFLVQEVQLHFTGLCPGCR